MLYTTYEKFRDKKKMTDAEIQKKTGISQQYMFGWKSKEYQPSGKKILPIAKLLNIPIEKALEFENEL